MQGQVLKNVRIGLNVIIGACSLITKDVPDNSAVAGVPAKKICDFNEYTEKRLLVENAYLEKAEAVSETMEESIWTRFRKDHR